MEAATPSNMSDAHIGESAHRRNLTALLTIVLVLYWLIAFLGTHIPLRILAGVMPPHNGDKVLHFVGYAILAALLMGLRASRGSFGWRSVVRRWMLLAVYGAFDEVTQRLVGRHADVADWCADMVGVLCGLGLVVLLVRVCSSRSVKRKSPLPADKAA